MTDHPFPLFAPGDILDIDGIEHVDVVLYAVIFGLCHTNGCCHVSNDTLSKRLKIGPRSIQRSLKRLHGFNLIFAEHDDNNRRIFLVRHDTVVTGVTSSVSLQDDAAIFLVNKKERPQPNFEEQLLEEYKKYPIRKGKTIGIKRLKSQIRSEETMEEFRKAIKNYVAECKGIEPQYVKHFSTFANCWRDYIESNAATKNQWQIVTLVNGKLVSENE